MWKTKLIFCLLLFYSIAVNGQTITIQESSIEVAELIKEISKQSGADFSFNAQLVDTKKRISFKIKNASLRETLDLLSKKINVKYEIIEGQIVLNALALNKKIKIQNFTLTGYLSDQATGEDLISASIAIKGTNQGVLTNEFGYYALPLTAGKHTIVYSYVGFEQTELELVINKNRIQNIALVTSTTELPAVIVEPISNNILNQNQLGEMEISPETLNNLPEFGGESGLVKGLQTLPGIKTHSDGSAFFYVRGGARDQNLIIIDDAPIYNPSHLLGFYSIVLPDFTKSISVYKSDMPTTIGDQLSSIISVRTKDGNLNKTSFGGSINPLMYQFSLETPIIKKRSAIFLSFRRSNYEWIYKRNNSDAALYFQDIHFKWNLKINNNNRIFFTLIQSADVFENQEEETNGIRWGNIAATLRWNHIYGPKLFSNTTIYTGNYAYLSRFSSESWKSDLGMLSLKSDFTHYASSRFTAKFGLELQAYFNTPGQLTLSESITNLPNITANSSQKSVLYYSGKYNVSDRLQINAGLRLINWKNLGPKTYYDFDDNFIVSDTITVGEGVYNKYVNLDPRLSLQYKLNNSSQVKLSYGLYHQYLQLISNATSPFNAFEVWLPANPNIKPQSSSQIALNYLKYFEQSKMEISAAAYYKSSKNQIDYEPHATTYVNALLEGELRFGKAKAYGFEVLLKKDFGRLNGWLAYTYSRAFKQFQDLNNGARFRAFQDRPHDFSIALNYRLSKRVHASAYWTSYSGSPFSSPVGFYTFNDQTIPLYGERNNDRLPSYQRLDLSMKFILNKKENSRFQHSLIFSIYNALGHKNIYAIRFNKIPSDDLNPSTRANFLTNQNLTATQIDLVRFFPSLSYKFKI